MQYEMGNCAILQTPGCLPPTGYCTENVVVRYAWFQHGAGILARCGNELHIENSAFTDNLLTGEQFSHMYGALTLGFKPYPATARVTNTRFINNTATAGAAIYLDYDSIANISSCEFTSNYAAYLESDPRSWPGSHCVEFDCNRGGAIFLGGQAHAYIDRSTFTANIAKDGGAIYVLGGTGLYMGFGSLSIQDSMFRRNAIMAQSTQKGTHIYASSSPALFFVRNTTFDPIDLDKAVALNRLAGCQEFACDPGNACAYFDYSLFCTPCDVGTVSKGGVACSVCPPGQGPDFRQAGCRPCEGNTVSSAGFEVRSLQVHATLSVYYDI
jgi:predicted outer membrane repeat protein